ncbi:MAG: hypothetical protein KIS68_13655 [Bauldia sp.]|nr:hypothetical protein [Bauldia sp.]
MSAEAGADFIPLDGNAVAGDLSELFARDVTTATIRCGGCGSSAEIGAVRVYGGAMGSIFRCFTCDTAVIRMVRTPRGFAIEMRGAALLLVNT